MLYMHNAMPKGNGNNRPPTRTLDDAADHENRTTADFSAHELLAGALQDSKRASQEVRRGTFSTFSTIFRKPSRATVWRRGWKVPLAIVGFYILALVIAVAHHALFIYLNGRIVNLGKEDLPFSSTNVPQAYATTFSLALVTAFRAAMIASIGLCYTQCLWKKLRVELLQIGLIEELFQIRNNALRLLKPAVVRHAPILLSIAVLSWLLPVAMIYPPGALVVGLDYRNVAEQFNVSVIPSGSNFSQIAGGETRRIELNAGYANITVNNATSKVGTIWHYENTHPNLLFVAKTVLASSKVLDLGRPFGTNISYTLQFQGPMLRCNETTETNQTILYSENIEPYVPEDLPRRERTKLRREFATYGVSKMNSGLVIQDMSNIPDYLSVAPCPTATNGSYQEEKNSPKPITRFQIANGSRLLGAMAVKRCFAAVAKYNVDISFINGVQNISYSTSETQPLEVDTWHPEKNAFHTVKSVQEYASLLALIESFINNFDIEGRSVSSIGFDLADLASPKRIDLTYDNGTVYRSYLGCKARPVTTIPLRGSSILALSAFNKMRISKTELSTMQPHEFSFTEDLLNEALANITISSLSLNTHFQKVDGTSTRVFNVYHFENRLSFYLPYGLCLIFTLPVLVLGLSALQHNGVTAMDGGFVQLLMTTTGRTVIEDAAGAGCMGGEENVPKELKKMRVRFGEMVQGENLLRAGGLEGQEETSTETLPVAQDLGSSGSVQKLSTRNDTVKQFSGMEGQRAVRRVGFGLLEETLPLEKGVQYGWTKD